MHFETLFITCLFMATSGLAMDIPQTYRHLISQNIMLSKENWILKQEIRGYQHMLQQKVIQILNEK